MRTYVYPADRFGCGHFRVIWPAEEARRRGHDVEIVLDKPEYDLRVVMHDNMLADVRIPDDADVIVIQRPTFRLMPEAVRIITEKGVAVVVDVDDDLTCIHPKNTAFDMLHPKNQPQTNHSWRNVSAACRYASLVTVSSEALVPTYAAHGRVRVVPNCVPDFYLDVPHEPNARVGWAGSTHSHPDDLQVMGRAVEDACSAFWVVGTGDGVADALGFTGQLTCTGATDPLTWPHVIAQTLGIGIAPLADTKFNAAKSYLKPLEYAALGIPSVVSPRAEYRKLAATLPGVVRLAQRPRDWVRAIETLSGDPDLRFELGVTARERVRELHTMSVNAWRWVEAWAKSRDYAGKVRSSR